MLRISAKARDVLKDILEEHPGKQLRLVVEGFG
jgi:hypothetical protein